MTSVNNIRRGLPLTNSRIEKIFPKLTPAQVSRIAAHGHVRSVQSGEVLIEQGEKSVPFFVVITGEVEIVRPCGAQAEEPSNPQSGNEEQTPGQGDSSEDNSDN